MFHFGTARNKSTDVNLNFPFYSDEPDNSIELDEIDQLQLVDTVKTMNKKLMNRLKKLEVASTYYKKKQRYLENALKKVNTNYNEFVVDASKILVSRMHVWN